MQPRRPILRRPRQASPEDEQIPYTAATPQRRYHRMTIEALQDAYYDRRLSECSLGARFLSGNSEYSMNEIVSICQDHQGSEPCSIMKFWDMLIADRLTRSPSVARHLRIDLPYAIRELLDYDRIVPVTQDYFNQAALEGYERIVLPEVLRRLNDAELISGILYYAARGNHRHIYEKIDWRPFLNVLLEGFRDGGNQEEYNRFRDAIERPYNVGIRNI